MFYLKRTTFFGSPDDGTNDPKHVVLFQRNIIMSTDNLLFSIK